MRDRQTDTNIQTLSNRHIERQKHTNIERQKHTNTERQTERETSSVLSFVVEFATFIYFGLNAPNI